MLVRSKAVNFAYRYVDSMDLDDMWHVSRVEQEQNQTEDAALRNTTRDQRRFRHLTIGSDGLRHWQKEPIQDRVVHNCRITDAVVWVRCGLLCRKKLTSNMPTCVTSPFSAAESVSLMLEILTRQSIGWHYTCRREATISWLPLSLTLSEREREEREREVLMLCSLLTLNICY